MYVQGSHRGDRLLSAVRHIPYPADRIGVHRAGLRRRHSKKHMTDGSSAADAAVVNGSSGTGRKQLRVLGEMSSSAK